MGKKKLHRLSRVLPKAHIDSAAEEKARRGTRAFDVLHRARQCWMQMEQFRQERERNKNYTYGRQWDDTVCVDGRPEDSADSQEGNHQDA